MTAQLPPGVQLWIGLPGPGMMLAALRERAERGHRVELGTLRITLTEQGRREIGRLLGTQWEVTGQGVNLRLLAAKLAEHGLTTRGVLEAVGGPIIVRREARAAERERVLTARERAAQALVAAGVPELVATDWAAGVAVGDLGPAADTVAKVWGRLPGTAAPVRLAQLAANVLNDSHALDANTHLGRVVARLAATVHGLPRPGRTGTPWRAAWRSVGVACDAVSSRALVLNLPLSGPSPAAAICAHAPGEPVWLTQRMLEREWTCDPVTVHVCENPTVVEAAADTLGTACPALVCTDGIASAAATGLIAGLAAAGCRLIARADFDEAGLTVVGQILAVAPAMQTWRFDQASYAQLVTVKEDAASAPDLREAIRIGGVIHEERMLDVLLEDLRREAELPVPGSAT